MSAERGDVEARIDALVARAPQMHQRDFAVAALPLLMEASAALERVERERDRLIENVQACNERSRNLAEKADRAEKAERVLAEMREALERYWAGDDLALERLRGVGDES